MERSPQVVELWRFPVKSMQGERVERLDVGPLGVVGDRAYGVVDEATGLLVSAKADARLFEAFAWTEDDGAVVVRLPDGSEREARDPSLPAAVSEWLERPVRIARPGGTAAYDMTLDPPNDDAEHYEIPTPVDTFLDLAALHILTTASLLRCSTARPDLVWDVRRFRPNVLVEHDGAGFPEDAWVGEQVALGSDVVAEGLMRTMRCAMPLRPQPAAPAVGSPVLERSADVFRAMSELHANDLGLYASVVTGGTIRLGDPVTPR